MTVLSLYASPAVLKLATMSRPGWGDIRKSVSLKELTEALEEDEVVIGETRVALEMRHAVKNGYAERAGPRTITQTWIATPKADALLPEVRA